MTSMILFLCPQGEHLTDLSYCFRISIVDFQLRYYATFKVRKFESLFYKINIFLPNITTSTGLHTEQILSINIYTHIFSMLGVVLRFLFLWFLKAPAFCGKKILKFLLHCTSICFAWTQKTCLRSFKSYFKPVDVIFLSFVVSF